MNRDSSRAKRPQRLQARLREATREAILDAAEAALLARGLEAPLEVIAERAGVAVGTLYNHFTDRKALLAAVLARHRETLLADVKAAEARTAGAPVREQLAAMLTAMIASWSKLYLVVNQTELPDAKRRGENRERLLELFGPVLERARRKGQLKADREGLQALALQGLLRSYVGLALDAPRRLSPERAVELILSVFLEGVGTGK